MDLLFLHFIRPQAFLLLIPISLLIGLMIKRQGNQSGWGHIIEPHLLKHLLISQTQSFKKLPAVWFMGLVLILMTIALSGPAWQQKPQSFNEDKSEVVFVLKVTDSMMEKDLSPNRLSRAVFKMHDLLKERAKIKASLVAYSGSAHLVMPLTQDKEILYTFAQSLEPEVMPIKGDALADAIKLARQQFIRSGTIIILTDSIIESVLEQIKKDTDENNQLILYAIASPELINLKQIKKASSKLNSKLVVFSHDEHDINDIRYSIENYFKKAQSDNIVYEDNGYWFVPIIALLVLSWFRRGFLAQVWRLS